MKTISIVTPCYNEEESIAECVEAVRQIFRDQLGKYRLEHIFCDNCSTDRTVEILKEIAAKDPSVKIIVNSRNFGILKNTYNGVLAAGGDAVLLFLPSICRTRQSSFRKWSGCGKADMRSSTGSGRSGRRASR